jgi:putative membrane protein
MRQLFESFAGFDDFLLYLAVAVAMLGFFIAVYVKITPYKEIDLIRAGNMSASFSLSGAIIGFVIPLASAVEHSVNLVDMLLWALIAMAVQLLTFVAVKLAIPNLARDVPAGQTAQGFFLGSVSLGVGILNAACMSY